MRIFRRKPKMELGAWISHGLVHRITPEGSVTHQVRGGIFVLCNDIDHLRPDA